MEKKTFLIVGMENIYINIYLKFKYKKWNIFNSLGMKNKIHANFRDDNNILAKNNNNL